jgi:outer membrane protein assembly factor BamB
MRQTNKPLSISTRERLQTALILLCLSFCGVYPTLPGLPTPTPIIPPKRLVSQTLPLKEKWRISVEVEAIMSSGRTEQYLWQWTPQGLVFANRGEGQLALLDSQSGQRLWQVTYKEQIGAHALVADEARVYLASSWRISAYSLATGQLLWQTDKQTPHRGYDLYLRNGFLFEYEIGRDYRVHKFDRETGVKLETQVLPAETPLIVVWLAEIDLGRADNWLWAIDNTTNQVLWRVPRETLAHMNYPPVAAAGLLVMTDNSTLYISKLDIGEILWQQSEIVSNPVVLDNRVYAMAVDASIRAYDLGNGEEVGILQIEPPVTTDAGYALTANLADKMIYAYYGDSEEIIAFGR